MGRQRRRRGRRPAQRGGALDRALAGNGVHVGYLGLGAWLVGTPGMPEDASPMEPDEVAPVLWDMHSGRNPAERLITP